MLSRLRLIFCFWLVATLVGAFTMGTGKRKNNIDSNRQSVGRNKDNGWGYFTPYTEGRDLPGFVSQSEMLPTLTSEGNLWQSAADGDVAALERSLSRGMTLDERDSEDRTPLFYASQEGRYEAVDFLLINGADINMRDMYGLTPLMAASAGGHATTVRLLLERGADVNARTSLTNPPDQTAFEIAKHQGHLHIIQLLKDFGVKG